MTQPDQTNTVRPAIIGTLNLLAVEHLRNIIIDRDDDGTVCLSAACPFCRDIMEWASDDT